MRLRPPQSLITQSKEGKPPARSLMSKLTQWGYMGLLVGVVIYVVLYQGYAEFYFTQRGWVEVQQVRIASIRGGRILEMPVSVGSHVNRGDLLLRVKSPNMCKRANSKALRNLKLEIAADRAKLRSKQRQQRVAKEQLKRFKYRRAMELIASQRGSERRLEESLISLNEDVALLRSAIHLKQQELSSLRDEYKAGLAEDDASCKDELIYAPADGKIVAVQRQVFEMLQRTETALDFVAHDAPVYIEAYFRTGDYKVPSVGKEVDVRFPDDSSSRGRISRIMSTATPFSEKKYGRYLLRRTRVLAVIEPLDIKESDHWRKFIRFETEVSGWR